MKHSIWEDQEATKMRHLLTMIMGNSMTTVILQPVLAVEILMLMAYQPSFRQKYR